MARDIRLFYLYRIVSRFYFHLPVLFIYFYMAQIKVYQIEILLAAYGLMIMLTSQVSVALLRFMNQKGVIAFGELLKAVGLLIMIIDTNFWTALAGQIVTGLGYSIAAGTDSSLLRHICSGQDPQVYQKAESGSQSYVFLSSLSAGIVGSVLFGFDTHYAFYASVLANAVSIVSILMIQEAKVEKATLATGGTKAPRVRLNLAPTQRFWMGYYALSRAVTLAPFVGFLPFFFFTELHVNKFYFGLVLSLFSVAAFFSARYAVRASQRFGSRAVTTITMSVSVLSMIVFGLTHLLVFGLLAITMMGFASGGVRPLTISNLNRTEMSAQERTSLLSSMERQYGFWNALLLLVGGYVITVIGFQALMLGLAAAYVLMLIYFFMRYGKAGTLNEKKDGQVSM